MLFSFLALALSMLYLNYSCNASNFDKISIESLQSKSAEKNGLVANPMSLFQNSEEEKYNSICLSASCVTAAASLINNMDQSVDPCDDFYQFACGNYLENTILNDEELLRCRFTAVEEEITNKLHMIVTEPIQLDELRPFKMLKSFFKSCMDQEQIEKIGLGPIKEILKSIGGWPVLEAEKWNKLKFTWIDTMQKLIAPNQNMGYFIKLSVVRNPKNNTQSYLYLTPASLGLKKAYLLKGKGNTAVKEYYRYMVEIAELFGADPQRAINEMEKSLEFEIELAKIEEQLGEIKFQQLQFMNISNLQQMISNTPWLDFLNKLFIHQNIITALPLKYWAHMGILLSKTPIRVQANYVIWRFVMDSVSYLNDELRKKQQNYKNELIKPRWKKCMLVSTELFKLVIGSLYVRRVYNENHKQNILEMMNGIMEDFNKMLSYNEWMDDETRKHAIDKAKSMTNVIEYPNELLDDSKLNAYYEHLEVNDQDFYTSALNLTKFKIHHEFRKLKQPISKLDWIFYGEKTNDVNTYYIPSSNSFMIPAGILHDMFFSNDRPQYMIYSAIGWLISHEITHGFDDTGRMFDQHGNMVDWWAEETNKRFLEKEKCFIRQYENYTVHEIGLKVNGILTLGDNIADNGGVSLAYNAYREWAKGHDVEPLLPGLQKYTRQQIFWLSAANMWCSKESRKFKEFKISDDSHSPNRFRVIGSFSNMKEFSADFQCALGSNMNPVKKCQVW